ncbi:ferritin-like domain-containing protein [Zhaonella formicivorans]|uniref:ferritin-like domain-containing protein n=1 Tax=Zhaonella formicivorans TaxID=2528593 RepID=UPI001D0F9067|nr:ferritin-like domain-containing protein [Zhaonella formicivorans]
MPEYTRRDWIDLIHHAIMDEMNDAAYYREMAKMAPDYEARELLTSMSDDETRHAEQFTEVYRAMTGKQPSPMQHHPMVSGYKEALKHRFHAETGAYKKYKEYYLCSENMKLRNIFFDAMHDEARHAMYLQYLMHQHCCAMMHHHEHGHKYPGEGCKPGYGHKPDYGYKPGYGYGPGYGHEPGYDCEPDYGSEPDYEGEPGYDDKPGYKEPAFGKLESENSLEDSDRDYYRPPAYKYPGYK